jgi:hypothetical protein
MPVHRADLIAMPSGEQAAIFAAFRQPLSRFRHSRTSQKRYCFECAEMLCLTAAAAPSKHGAGGEGDLDVEQGAVRG